MPVLPKSHTQLLREKTGQTKDCERRGSASSRGYDRRWQKAREWFLRLFPLCRHCEDKNRVVVATVVDHIIPHRGNQQLFWDKTNWQPLCETCHNIKTANGG